MEAKIVSIRNSKGIRIPKTIVILQIKWILK